MTNRRFVAFTIWATLSLIGVTVGWSDTRPPNFVFIYADDLGFGDLACHGHPRIATPNLDAMAARGTDFHQFTVVNPVCSPSRAAILTGQFPSRLGIHQHFASHAMNVERGMPDWLDPAVPCLPRLLKEQGYRTAHYGKWHLSGGGIDDAPQPAAYGYDDAATWTGGGKHVFEGTRYGKMKGEGEAHGEVAASYLSVAATDHAVDFIRQNAADPFYINLWLHETHALVTATEQEKAAYADVFEPQRTYYAAATRADTQVGRIMELLDELNLDEQTLVIFSSDNGPENSVDRPGHKLYHSRGSTGGLRGRKRSLLMGGVNVPFLAVWPGHVPAGRTDRTTPIAGVDILPTFLSIAGIDSPQSLVADGIDVSKALFGEPTTRQQPILWYWQGHHGGDDWPAWAIRDNQWVLVRDETGDRTELYDVIADRQQTTDLADQHPDRVASMTRSLDQWAATLPESPPAEPIKTKPKESKTRLTTEQRTRVFGIKDTDADGRLSLAEFSVRLPDASEARRRFELFDTDGDGVLTLPEFASP